MRGTIRETTPPHGVSSPDFESIILRLSQSASLTRFETPDGKFDSESRAHGLDPVYACTALAFAYLVETLCWSQGGHSSHNSTPPILITVLMTIGESVWQDVRSGTRFEAKAGSMIWFPEGSTTALVSSKNLSTIYVESTY